MEKIKFYKKYQDKRTRIGRALCGGKKYVELYFVNSVDIYSAGRRYLLDSCTAYKFINSFDAKLLPKQDN